MFSKKVGKRSFDDYEKSVKEKKKGKTKEEAPSIIAIQRMTLNKVKRKYEVEAVRENVDFSAYAEISINNIQLACEAAFNAPPGSCEILMSASGPTAIQEWQIQKKQFYFIHFKVASSRDDGEFQTPTASVFSHSDNVQSFSAPKEKIRKPEKSVSIVDILRASKLKTPVAKSVHKISLERFRVADGGSWDVEEGVEVVLEDEQVDDGGFRICFNCTIAGERWMLKRLKPHRIEEAKDVLLSDEEHTRKQVQMHMVAKSLTEMFNMECPKAFGETFEYDEIYFAIVNGKPATLERFIEGKCTKYICNSGICPNPDEGVDVDVFAKAQALAHYTWQKSGRKLLLLDIQGSGYQLYDPEIATPVAVVGSKENDSKDIISFCMGNMSLGAIKLFMNTEHKCEKWCEMVGLTRKQEAVLE